MKTPQRANQNFEGTGGLGGDVGEDASGTSTAMFTIVIDGAGR